MDKREGINRQNRNFRNSFDINGPDFDSDVYCQRLIKESSLSQLMANESDIMRQIQSLDSDMQTLVYDNYNKFITATDTIRKMGVDFRALETEMEQLGQKINRIVTFSGQVSETLHDQRKRISELSSTHALMKKMQFLFELPAKMTDYVERGDYATCVKYYLRAQQVLKLYDHQRSFNGIKEDCDKIAQNLRSILLRTLSDTASTTPNITLAADLLLRLNEPMDALVKLYLEASSTKLDDALAKLNDSVGIDILEFVDICCNSILGEICLISSDFTEIFSEKSSQLTDFIHKYIYEILFELVRRRFMAENDENTFPVSSPVIFVRALDRFYRRIQGISRLLDLDMTAFGLDLVLDITAGRSKHSLERLSRSFDANLVDIRKSLSSRLATSTELSMEEINALPELNNRLLNLINDSFQTELGQLLDLFDPELSFSVEPKFRHRFGLYQLRNDFLVLFLRQRFIGACNEIVGQVQIPPELLLLLSRTCLDMRSSSMTQYINRCGENDFSTASDVESQEEESIRINDSDEEPNSVIIGYIKDNLENMASKLLNQYVRLEGQVLSQMLRKSVATRDWFMTVEPRSVRAVMKRIVEDISWIDRRVGSLFEEGTRRARSSDSSRRLVNWSRNGARSRPMLGSTSQIADSSLASNIQKMFCERIEIFSRVSFSRVSILTGIVKIALKTLLECVRLKTFSRFGFQQVQVDTHYLELYLWRFVSDENLVSFLLDEILTSVVHRCLDPISMEHSVVEVICDRG